MRRITEITFLIFVVFLVSPKLFAAEPEKWEDEKGIFGIVLENDILSGTDREYTNGIRLSYISPEAHMPSAVRKTSNYLPLLSPQGKKRISFALGQSMFTPNNTATSTPDPSDRPYAGWLYTSLGIVSDTGKILDNVVLTLGVVGPAAYGKQTQKYVHHVVGSPQPNGWAYQLKNEPGVVFTYERKWREVLQVSQFGMKADLMPHVGINLGNVNTDASVGTTLRLGFNLPVDYGPPRIRPSLPGSDFFIPTRKIGGYLFATVEGRAVARNIFLDGNSFQNSPRVHKEPLIGSLQFGIALTLRNTRISMAHILLTQEFQGQQGGNAEFDALTLSWRF